MDIVLITGSGRLGGLGFEIGKVLGLLHKKECKESSLKNTQDSNSQTPTHHPINSEKMFHIILSGRDESKLKKCVENLQGQGVSADFVILDILDSKSVKNALKSIESKYKKLNILINNAALMKAGASFAKMDLAEMRNVMEANLFGTWQVSQAFLPLLQKARKQANTPFIHSKIINISSGAGSLNDTRYGFLKGLEGLPASGYGISKLAQNGLTIKMARELMNEGIAVNAACPDITDSHNFGFGRKAIDSAKGVAWIATMGLSDEILESSLGEIETRVAISDYNNFIEQKVIESRNQTFNKINSKKDNFLQTDSINQDSITPDSISIKDTIKDFVVSKISQTFMPKPTPPLIETNEIIESKMIDLIITKVPQNLHDLSGRFYRDSIQIPF